MGKKGEESSRRREFSAALWGNAVYYASQWLLLVILAKLGSSQSVGEYTLGVSICSPVLLLTNLQLRTVLAADVGQHYPFGHYLRLRLIASAIGLGVVGAICWLQGMETRKAELVLLVALSLSLEILGEVYYGRMQREFLLERMAVSLTLKGVMSLLVTSYAMWATSDVLYAVLGLIIVRSTVWLVFDRRAGAQYIPESRNNSAAAQRQPIRGLVISALVMGIILMLGSLNFNIPRYFVEGELSTSGLGIYAALSSILGIGNLLVAATCQSAFVRIARAHHERDAEAFRRACGFTLLMAFSAGALLMTAARITGPAALTYLFRPEYGGYSTLLTWLLATGWVSYMTTAVGTVLTAGGCVSPQIPLLLLSCTVTACGCYLFIPANGLVGAAQGSLMGNVVLLIASSALLIVRVYSARDDVDRCPKPLLATL